MFSGLLKQLGFRVKDERGLTLIELVTVVVILGIAAGLLVPRVIGRADQARVNRALSDLQAMKSVIEVHCAEYGKVPSNPAEVSAVMQAGGIYWTGGTDGVADPWGKGYVYGNVDPEAGTYTIMSEGKDGVENTADDIFATDKRQPTQGACTITNEVSRSKS